MDLKPILATAVGIALYRGIVEPSIERYLAWRNGPRVQTARRNWRGVYVPDLGVRRAERLFWLALISFFLFGVASVFTIMVSGSN